MENTINSLAEIEERAQRIMEHATVQQKELSDSYVKKRIALEKDVAADTEAQLNSLKTRLADELENNLSKTREETDKALEAIQTEYRMHHLNIAKSILNDLTTVERLV